MSEEFQDEVTSINSIYEGNTLTPLEGETQIYALILPCQPQITLRLDFPPDYPNAPPSIVGTQHVGSELAKGEGSTIVESLQAVLAEVYMPGAPCIFDLIEESNQKLQQLGLDRDSRDEKPQVTQTHGQDDGGFHEGYDYSDTQQPLEELGKTPPWTISDVITEKKSVFVARAAPVESVDQAKTYLAHLLATDKKVAKATHNITAWRIRGASGVQFQDCDDDGEDAAGGRLLHLLELMNIWGVMVVISRWYGGIKLGPDRFRLINQCARDVVVKGGFAPAAEGTKKKGKK